MQPADTSVIPPHYELKGPRWGKQQMTYTFTGDLPGIKREDMIAALKQAFAQWSAAVPTLRFRPAEGSEPADIDCVVGELINSDPGQTRLEPSEEDAPVIRKATITFNNVVTWTTGQRDDPAPPYVAYIAAMHEIGHALGLAHSKNEDSVMWWQYNPRIRALTKDDKDGIRKLYGPNAVEGAAARAAPAVAGFRRIKTATIAVAWAERTAVGGGRICVARWESWKAWKPLVDLGEALSAHGPAMTALDDALVVAWTDTSKVVRAAIEKDGRWSALPLPEVKSNYGPGITATQGRLVIAWAEDGKDAIATMVSPAGTRGQKWNVNPVAEGRTTGAAPAVASLGSDLVIVAYTGRDSARHLNLMYSSNLGKRWDLDKKLGEDAIDGPALHVQSKGGTSRVIRLAWTGRDDSRRVNLMQSVDGGSTFTDRQVLGTAAFSPAIVVLDEIPVLAWTSRDENGPVEVLTL